MAALSKPSVIIGFIEKSDQYKEWKKGHPDAYLAHVFVMEDAPSVLQIQVGYFDEKHDRMCTFVIEQDSSVTVMPDLEVFKKPDAPILPLKKGHVGFDILAIMEKAKEVQAKEYPGQPIIKKFFVLQDLSIGQVFNVTFVTAAFKTINMKFESKSGELLKHSVDSLLSMDKPLDKVMKK